MGVNNSKISEEKLLKRFACPVCLPGLIPFVNHRDKVLSAVVFLRGAEGIFEAEGGALPCVNDGPV